MLVRIALLAVLVTMREAPEESHGIDMTLTVYRAAFPATQTPIGSLQIANTSGGDISFGDGSFDMIVRDGDGERNQSLFHHWSMVRTKVENDSSFTRHVGLPGCVVASDPCEVRVSVRGYLRSATGDTVIAQTNETSYAMVRDRRATFRALPSVREPIFIARQEKTVTIARRQLALEVDFRRAPDAAPIDDEEPRVAEILRNDGVTPLNHRVLDTRTAHRVTELLPNAPLTSALPRTIAAIEATFPRTFDAAFVNFTVDPSDDALLEFMPNTPSRAALQPFSDVLGAGELRDLSPLSGRVYAMTAADENGQPVPISVTPFPMASPIAPEQDPYRNAVVYAQSDAFYGSHAARSDALPTISDAQSAAYYGNDASSLKTFDLKLAIDSDRPEVVAFGRVSERSSNRFDAYAPVAAVALAERRARSLESALGHHDGPVSLVARFPSQNGDLQSASNVTVATAIGADETIDRTWRSIDSASVSSRSAPASIATVHASPVAEPPSQRRGTASDLVPIQLSFPRTQLVTYGDVPVSTSAAPHDDCESLVARAQQRSLDAALHRATAEQAVFHVTLRHLVLAAALPPSISPNGTCTHADAAAPSEFAVHAPVELRFRTF